MRDLLDTLFFSAIPIVAVVYVILLIVPGSMGGSSSRGSDWRDLEDALEKEESANDLGSPGDP